MCVQTPVLPLAAQESFSHVSLPNSPGFGIVLKVHRSLPVRTSKARARPLVLVWVTTCVPSLNAEPTITTSLTTVARRMEADLAGLQIDLLADAFHDADLEVEDPVRAKRVDHGARSWH